MLSKKIVAIFSVFLLVLANYGQAFSQDYTPQDKNLIYQTYFDSINVSDTWSNDISVNKDVVVAVLDSGVDLDHPDLKNNIWVNVDEIPGDGIDNDLNSYIDDVNGWDFVESNNNPQPNLDKSYDFVAVNHGTVVAGIIAASRNTTGIVGIAPQAQIMPLKILNEKGIGNVLVLAQAIDYAVENGADIINLSLVGQGYDDVLKDAINRAYNNGVVVVAASGNESNDGISLDIDPRYPVCDIGESNRVLGVAAVDRNNKLAKFSNYGEQCIDVSSVGTNFYSTVYNDSSNASFRTFYDEGWSGTSVAAPTVSATAALIKMNFPSLRPYDIINIIRASSQSLRASNPLRYTDLGTGLLDVSAALNFAKNYHEVGTKIVLAPQAGLDPELVIMDNEGNMESLILAYGINFKGGINVATGDVSGNGSEDIITAPMAGGGPHIRVFDVAGTLISEFFAYDARFTGGVNVSTGDVDGDGVEEIITAPMAGGGPHIKVFGLEGNLLGEFFSYEASFDGGVNVASGDVNNDGRDEIVVAPMSKRGPEIKVYNFGGSMKSRFFAYSKTYTSGVNISVADVNNDNWPEIVASPRANHLPELKLFSLKGRDKGNFLPYSVYLKSGFKVVADDLSGDGLPEILTLPNRGDVSLLKSFDSNGLEKSSFFLRHPNDLRGYNFAILANSF